jgi:cysteine desulfurase
MCNGWEEDMDNTPIYLDYAATTPTDPRVVEAMLPYFSDRFSNASSLYAAARVARQALDAARATVANAIGARPSEVIVTSGGTESDNAAIKGVVWAARERGNHLITTTIEHHAVLHTAQWLARFGIETTMVPVGADGSVDPAAIEAAIRPTTVLISVMHANNEVGTIQPLAEIGAIARRHHIPFHTDAVQTVAHLPLDVQALNVDLLSLSAHKFYGPKGVGALYVRRGTPWLPQMQGGGQERNRRAGTENAPGVVGMATALSLALAEQHEEMRRLAHLRDRCISGILDTVPGSRLNGHATQRLPNNVNVAFEGIDGESLVLSLDRQGIAASTGSACTAGSIDPSHVLLALGLPGPLAAAAIRFSLGRFTTDEHIDRVLSVLPTTVARLRSLGGPTAP